MFLSDKDTLVQYQIFHMLIKTVCIQATCYMFIISIRKVGNQILLTIRETRNFDERLSGASVNNICLNKCFWEIKT